MTKSEIAQTLAAFLDRNLAEFDEEVNGYYYALGATALARELLMQCVEPEDVEGFSTLMTPAP